MKKIPKSITVTVRILKNDSCMLVSGPWRGTTRPCFLLREVFGKVPASGYRRITYTENKRGAYEITGYVSGGFCYIRNRRGGGIRTCFIPAYMSGLRVSRKVTPIRKGGGK